MRDLEHPLPLTSRDLSVLVESDHLFFSLWIGGIPHERNSLIKLKHSRVKRWSSGIWVEDLGMRLVADEQKIFESFRDAKYVFAALFSRKIFNRAW